MIIDCLSYYIMDLIIIFVYLYSPILIIVCFILINDGSMFVTQLFLLPLPGFDLVVFNGATVRSEKRMRTS